MTMYVRTTVSMTLTISSQTEDDDVLLDANHPYAVLPLWAAQRDEFQALWDDGQVEVATDPDFDNIITEIPASELGAGAIPLDLPLDTVVGTSDINPGAVMRFLSGDNAEIHYAFANSSLNQEGSNAVAWGVWYEGPDGGPIGDVDILCFPGGNGRLWVNYAPVVTALAEVSFQVVNEGDNYLLGWIDTGRTLLIESGGPCQIVVPTMLSGGFQLGAQVHVIQRGTGSVTIVGETPDTSIVALDDANAVAGRFAMATLTMIEDDLWTLTGQITTVT